ncbi:MAG TPA: SigE family RNA polymerase sigma factor [Nakamurella sp.]
MGTSSAGRDLDEEFRLFAGAQRPALYRVALVLTADPGVAEDLVQTALMRTHARWPRLRDQDPGGYARRVITNANIDRWRRDRGRERLTAEVPEGASGDLAAGVAERDAVLRALAGLTAQERKVVVLRFLDDFSEADTAKVLGMPLGTVKSITHRAIARLREDRNLDRTREVNP